MTSHRRNSIREILVVTALLFMLLFATFLPPAAANSPTKNPAQVNQGPTTRSIIIDWTKTASDQDRFYPDFIIVNQGDTVALTFINNDTVVHDLVIGPPYNIMVNASVPGLYDDVTGQLMTTPATRNSPGVQVSGTPGNVSATYSFLAKYPGIFEFVCSYHIDVGMIGYLVVFAPNTSGITQPNVPNQTVPQSSSLIQASIDAGSGVNVNLPGYTPTDITVVIGINNTVKWTNNDNMPHTVTASDGSFDSGSMNPGATYLYTFTKPGVYHYVCTYHNWMHGTVTVVSETIGSESEEHGELTVVLTANEIYGIVGFGIVTLLAIMLVLGRTKREQQPQPLSNRFHSALVNCDNDQAECMNGRNREKITRGLERKDSPILTGYQLFHNYIRPHVALEGKTPAEVAGILIQGKNKWLTLIQNASQK